MPTGPMKKQSSPLDKFYYKQFFIVHIALLFLLVVNFRRRKSGKNVQSLEPKAREPMKAWYNA